MGSLRHFVLLRFNYAVSVGYGLWRIPARIRNLYFPDAKTFQNNEQSLRCGLPRYRE